MTCKVKRKWSELELRDKKFTCLTVVDYGVVRSTRKKRKVRGNVGENVVVDNRKKLKEMASKAKTSYKIDKKDKKLLMGGNSDKKKRKREDKTEEKIEASSVPKRKKLISKGDNLRETRQRSRS